MTLLCCFGHPYVDAQQEFAVMQHRHRAFAAIAQGMALLHGVPETADIAARPRAPVDCEQCKHRADQEHGHCYMFKEKPGPYCAQFQRDHSAAAVARTEEKEAQIQAIRDETKRRRAEHFAKRQPKSQQ